MKKPPVKKQSLLLRCGCTVTFRENALVICPTHGSQSVVRAVNFPPPRIRGVATGPHVRTEDLAPSFRRLAGSERVKES